MNYTTITCVIIPGGILLLTTRHQRFKTSRHGNDNTLTVKKLDNLTRTTAQSSAYTQCAELYMVFLSTSTPPDITWPHSDAQSQLIS
jgi:hypothetical protein